MRAVRVWFDRHAVLLIAVALVVAFGMAVLRAVAAGEVWIWPGFWLLVFGALLVAEVRQLMIFALERCYSPSSWPWWFRAWRWLRWRWAVLAHGGVFALAAVVFLAEFSGLGLLGPDPVVRIIALAVVAGVTGINFFWWIFRIRWQRRERRLFHGEGW